MTCQEMHDFLMAYLDGELPAEQHALFTKHLDRCGPCVHYLHSYKVTVRISQAAFAEPETAMPDELVRAILTSRQA